MRYLHGLSRVIAVHLKAIDSIVEHLKLPLVLAERLCLYNLVILTDELKE